MLEAMDHLLTAVMVVGSVQIILTLALVSLLVDAVRRSNKIIHLFEQVLGEEEEVHDHES